MAKVHQRLLQLRDWLRRNQDYFLMLNFALHSLGAGAIMIYVGVWTMIRIREADGIRAGLNVAGLGSLLLLAGMYLIVRARSYKAD